MRTILLLLSCLVALPALAQTPGDVLDLTLEELLRQDTVSAASKFPQPTVDAPASITIVSADDIRRQGYQTLHEILQGINGLYVTSDRNYSYLGMRGFARPGDYNTRVLLLIDGHRINDPVYDMALLGGDFPLEVSLIERVEVIRGPASALYGTSAFLGVINVITRSGRELRGAQGEFGVGSLATQSGRTSFGAASGGRDLLVSAYGRRSDGARDLFFPEFATPDTHDGFVSNADQEGSAGAFVSASIGRISVRAVAHRRDKRVPTASWGSLFGDPSTTRDERSYIDLVYSGRFRGGWTGTARGSWDRMYYRGQYPYDYEDGLGRTLWSDEALSHEVGGELALTRTYTRNLVTIGGEFRRILTADQWGGQRGVLDVDDRREGRTWAVFAEDDLALIPRRLTLHAGMRLDHYESEGFEANPRVGLVYRPTPAASIKLLHGRAFRAPNYYERFYFGGMRAGLTVQPERIVTNEAIWEQRIGRRVRTSASVFHSTVSNLITARAFDGGALDGDLYFDNVGTTDVTGVEAEVEARWASGTRLRVAQSVVHARDGEANRISNSPTATGVVTLVVPLAGDRAFLGLEGRYLTDRQSVRATVVDGHYVQNATLTADRVGPFDLTLSFRNLFDRRYQDPGAEEHRQSAIPQDGRTIIVRAGVRF